jgi:hypothetical protein
VAFRMGLSQGQNGLVFSAVVPRFGCRAIREFDHNTASALGLALQLGRGTATDYIVTAVLCDGAGHLLCVVSITLGVVNGDFSNDVGFGHGFLSDDFTKNRAFQNNAYGAKRLIVHNGSF